MHIRRLLLAAFTSSKPKIPLSLAYPYQYSLSPQQFDLHDLRFQLLSFSREFANPQKEHVQFVLERFETIFNGNCSSNEIDQQYIQQSLKQKLKELQLILKQSDISLKCKIKPESVVKSSGYLQIKPAEGVSLAEKDLEYIHHYAFERHKQQLSVSLKPKKTDLTGEEQLKKDIVDKMGSKSKEIRQQLNNMHFSKQALFVDRMISKFMSIGKRQKKRSFQPYYIIEQVKGVMQYTMVHQDQTFVDDVVFDSRWLYLVNKMQSEDIKKHRRRVLFDFQYWNRGNFFPVKHFAAEVAQFD